MKDNIARRCKLAALLIISALIAGCARTGSPVAPKGPAPEYVAGTGPCASPFQKVTQAAHFPQNPGRQQLGGWIIARFYQRLMSHRDIEQNAARITNELTPLLREAVLQPQVREGLQQFAEDQNLSVSEAAERWVALQAADILLESGGDPDALSAANAAGVAQWLAGTARGVGMHVDGPASSRLTAEITALRCRIAWIHYFQRPDANPNAPGAQPVSAQDFALLPSLQAELEQALQKRRAIDDRYDSRKALFAQTRYLLRLYPRFPAADWLFQAYHGGEGGVARTLRTYLGAAWPGSVQAAIRGGDSGRPLSFETVYFTLSPSSHSEAFSYIYGRSDDHRHYWWKLRAAQKVLADYRASIDSFHTAWEASLPGRRIEALWYPDAVLQSLPDFAALQTAVAQKRLSRVQPGANFVIRPAVDDPGRAIWYQALKPEAKGALLQVVKTYQRKNGKNKLAAGDMILTQEYVERARTLHPPKTLHPPLFPPEPEERAGGGPLRRFDYHTVGLAFDILRPKDEKERKILEYALDTLENRQVISVLEARDQEERRYHIVPHPAYGTLFKKIAAAGRPSETF